MTAALERVCVVGAGAVGAVFGARIAGPLSVLARGATLDALRARGWSLDGAARPVTASDDPADLGEQDAEAGRPLELDAMLSAVREIAGLEGVPTPSLDALLGLTRLAARERGLYP